MANFLRGQIAKLANINIETLRYYENNELIPAPERNKSGYRIYPEEILDRLEFIKGARESGMTIQEIRRLFSMDTDSMTPNRISSFLDQKIAEIDVKILKLVQMKELLQKSKEDLHQYGMCPILQKYMGVIKNKNNS
jgi:DNA-binding transcriptional MerR regulator